MSVDNLKRWADGKHGLLTMYAQQVAVSAPECFQLCKLAETDDLFGFVKENVPPNVWLKFYRSRLKTQAKAIVGYVEENPLPEEFQERYEEAREAWTEPDGRVMIGAKKNAEVEKRLWETVEGWHYDQLECEGTAELAGNLFDGNPEAIFMFRVSMPCQLLWGQSVTKLYRKARLGEPMSVGRMLRLDPLTREDKRIRSKEIEILREGGKDAKTLKHELTRPNFRKITLGNMKVLLAAQISLAGRAIERGLKKVAKRIPGMKVGRIHLQEPEIRALFDAIAQDFHEQDIDTDLPESPESFAKGIQRATKFWPRF